jgi:hypothetical protein
LRTAGDKKQAVIVQKTDHGRNGELQMRECAGARGSCAGRTSSIWLQGQLQTQPSMGNRYLLQHQLQCNAAAAKILRPAAQSGDARAKYSPILERGTKAVIMQKLLQRLLHFRRRGVVTGQALAYTVEAQDVKQHGPKGGAQHVERLGKYGGKAVAFKRGGGGEGSSAVQSEDEQERGNIPAHSNTPPPSIGTDAEKPILALFKGMRRLLNRRVRLG